LPVPPSLDKRIATGQPLTDADIHEAAIEGVVQRLRPKLMTVYAVLASLIPVPWANGIGADVMKPIAAPMVGGMISSTIHVLILVPVFFVLMKERLCEGVRCDLLTAMRSRCSLGPLDILWLWSLSSVGKTLSCEGNGWNISPLRGTVLKDWLR